MYVTLRRTLAAPLFAAAVISVAGGIAGAAPAPDVVTGSSTSAPDPQHGLGEYADMWSLKNETGKSVYGNFTLIAGRDSSAIDITMKNPLEYGLTIKKDYDISGNKYVMAHICFDHMQRNLNNVNADVDGNRGFTLKVNSNVNPPALVAQWNEISGWSGTSQHEATFVNNVNEPRC